MCLCAYCKKHTGNNPSIISNIPVYLVLFTSHIHVYSGVPNGSLSVFNLKFVFPHSGPYFTRPVHWAVFSLRRFYWLWAVWLGWVQGAISLWAAPNSRPAVTATAAVTRSGLVGTETRHTTIITSMNMRMMPRKLWYNPIDSKQIFETLLLCNIHSIWQCPPQNLLQCHKFLQQHNLLEFQGLLCAELILAQTATNCWNLQQLILLYGI